MSISLRRDLWILDLGWNSILESWGITVVQYLQLRMHLYDAVESSVALFIPIS